VLAPIPSNGKCVKTTAGGNDASGTTGEPTFTVALTTDATHVAHGDASRS